MMVDRHDMSGVLPKHSEESNKRGLHDARGVDVNDSQAEQVPGWDGLVDELRAALAPKKPAPSFRRALKRDLVEMAQGRPHRQVLLAEPSTRRELVIGAAIGSAVALAGGIVYLLRMREHARARRLGDARLEQMAARAN